MTTTNRDRYIVSHLNGRFQVTDSAVAGVQIMNDQAKNADNTDPAQMKYFGMDFDAADALADQLNAKYNHFR